MIFLYLGVSFFYMLPVQQFIKNNMLICLSTRVQSEVIYETIRICYSNTSHHKAGLSN